MTKPYVNLGDMFLDWSPVPKRIYLVPRHTTQVHVPRIETDYLFSQVEDMYGDTPGLDPKDSVVLKELVLLIGDTIYRRKYGWHAETKTLITERDYRIREAGRHDARIW